MKRLGTILSFLAFSTVLSAQIRTVPQERLLEQVSPVLCADSAALSFDFLELDTPELSEDSDPVCLEFPFRNVSDREVVISRINCSCNCVKVSVSQQVLSPGQDAVLSAVYYPAGHPGKFQRRVFLYTSASDRHPAAVLKVNADVAWKTGPDAEYPFVCGDLRLRRNAVEISSKPETVHIRCFNSGDRALTVTAETAFLPFPLSFRCKPETVAPGGEAVLIIETRAEPACGGEFPLMLNGTGARPSESVIMIKKTKEQ
ncbi:MAG: DUF1573 domain-containing protein [Candidatus Cryptobacteroides sp.]